MYVPSVDTSELVNKRGPRKAEFGAQHVGRNTGEHLLGPTWVLSMRLLGPTWVLGMRLLGPTWVVVSVCWV